MATNDSTNVAIKHNPSHCVEDFDFVIYINNHNVNIPIKEIDIDITIAIDHDDIVVLDRLNSILIIELEPEDVYNVENHNPRSSYALDPAGSGLWIDC